MRALAVSAPGKLEGIPSLKEQGVDVVLGNWRGVFGAPAISTAQRDALVSAVKAATESATWKETVAKLGWDAVFLPGDQYKTFLEEDTKRITGILDSLGLKK
jgi:putative tricarboxylic transport membrane protein